VFEVQDGIRVRQFLVPRVDPRSAERDKGEAATAAAGRVGCAATVSRPPGRGLDTGLAALLDHRDGAVVLAGFDEPNSWPGRAGVRSAERGERKATTDPCARNRQIEISSTRPACAVGEPSPAPRRTRSRMSLGPAARFRPPASISRLWRWPGWRKNRLSWSPGRPFPTRRTPVPDEHVRPGATRLAVVQFPGSLGDHRIVALRST
jgi:hypothetical protein